MSRRTQRIESLLRDVIGQVILSKISDPRIDPARVSVTRVEVPEDLLTAKVFISVLGTPGDQRKTLFALRHATGRIQELMMRKITLRNTPLLSFDMDEKFKKTLETLQVIQQAMDELRHKDEAKAQAQDGSEAGAQDTAQAAEAQSPQPPRDPDDDQEEETGNA